MINSLEPRKLYNLCLSVVCSNLPAFETLVQLPKTVKTHILGICTKRDNISGPLLESLLNSNVLKLEAAGCNITDNDLELLALSRNLRKLDLNSLKINRRSITSAGLSHIAENCHILRELLLRRCDQIDDYGIVQICRKCTQLTVLNLSGCDKLTNGALVAISDLKYLQCIDISRNDNYSDDGVVLLAQKAFANLQECCMNHCKKLTDDSVYALTSLCKRLNILSFAGCPLMTEYSRELLTNMLSETPNLKLVTWTIEV